LRYRGRDASLRALLDETNPLTKHSNPDMKKLLLQAIACAAVLLPLSQAQAGNFPKGTTFTMTVTEKVSSKVVGFQIFNKAAVPKGIPNFKVGQKVKFTIGPKGQLMIKQEGVSLPFKQDGGSANVYYIVPTRKKPSGDIGEVFKDTTGKPTGTALSFFKFKYSGMTTTTNTVVYTLE
jgi:hypothetical protein